MQKRVWSPKTLLRVSIAVALLTIVLKGAAGYITNSMGLISDAMESFVNLASATFALAMDQAGVDKAVLAQGLKVYLEEFPRKDLALLAVRLLPPEEASRAIDAALEESPKDEELREARKR